MITLSGEISILFMLTLKFDSNFRRLFDDIIDLDITY